MAGIKIAELVGDGAPSGASSKFILSEENILREEILKAARESAKATTPQGEEAKTEEKRFKWDWNAFMQKVLIALIVAAITYWVFERKRRR